MKISYVSKINGHYNSTIAGDNVGVSVFNIKDGIAPWSSIGGRFGSCIKNNKYTPYHYNIYSYMRFNKI